MELFEEYKSLSRSIYKKRHFHEVRGEENIILYDEYIDRAFKEIEDELDEECINLRTTNGNFTHRKEVFESLNEDMQIKINNTLRELKSFKNWIKFLRKELVMLDDLANRFKGLMGEEAWEKYSNELGGEEIVIYICLLSMVKKLSGYNKTKIEQMSVIDLLKWLVDNK